MILDHPPQYTKAQINMLHTIFETFDVEETGYVSTSIIPVTLQTLGVKLRDEDMQRLIKEFDVHDSGRIEFDEYIELAKKYIRPEEDYKQLYAELREAFRIFDKEGKGYLSTTQFKNIIRELDSTLADNELDDIVEEVDTDGSGRIEFEEFVDVMMGDE